VCEALVPDDLPPDRTAEILHQKLLTHIYTQRNKGLIGMWTRV
jgi:hypothetical protein